MTYAYIFEVTTNIQQFPPFQLTQADIMEENHEMCMQPLNANEFERIQTYAIRLLTNNSFKIQIEQNGTLQRFMLKGNHISKKNYFYPKYQKLIHHLQQFDLSDMIDTVYMKKLQYLCKDTEKLYVYLWGTGIMTLDEFIREFQTEIPYYVSGIYQIFH